MGLIVGKANLLSCHNRFKPVLGQQCSRAHSLQRPCTVMPDNAQNILCLLSRRKGMQLSWLPADLLVWKALFLVAACALSVSSSADGTPAKDVAAVHQCCACCACLSSGYGAGDALLQFAGNVTNFNTISRAQSFQGWANGSAVCAWTGVKCDTDDNVISL